MADSLAVKQKRSNGCVFEPVSDDWRDHVGGYVERNITINVKDYPRTGNILAAEELGRDVRTLVGQARRGTYQCGPLYGLRVASSRVCPRRS